MSQHHTFFGKIFGWIGDLFEGLFNEAKKVYNKLTPEQQAALLHGAGIVDIINKNIEEAPSFIRDLIVKQYPDLDEAKLESGLFDLVHAFKLAPASNSFEDVVKSLQIYLKSLSGNIWAAISHSAASLLSILFSPADTKFASISSLLEFVYQHFIKKHD